MSDYVSYEGTALGDLQGYVRIPFMASDAFSLMSYYMSYVMRVPPVATFKHRICQGTIHSHRYIYILYNNYVYFVDVCRNTDEIIDLMVCAQPRIMSRDALMRQ